MTNCIWCVTKQATPLHLTAISSLDAAHIGTPFDSTELDALLVGRTTLQHLRLAFRPVQPPLAAPADLGQFRFPHHLLRWAFLRPHSSPAVPHPRGCVLWVHMVGE